MDMKSNKDKYIVSLCGGTGAWEKPYKDADYIIFNITLPDYDIREHYTCRGYIMFWKKDLDKYIKIPIKKIYGILAAPPCTQFSLARTTAKTPRDFEGGMRVVDCCLKIIWECQYKHKLKFWALENPVGLLRRFLGRPIYTFQPYEFGEMYTKRTDVWGYFNNPKKKYNEKEGLLIERKWESKFGGTRKASIRSITPAGFAHAFFKANR